jgi:outer membrane biosynthesis protein TonB
MTKEQVEALRSAGISESAIIDRILAESAGPGPENTDTGKKKPEAEPEQKPEPEKKPEKKPETQPAAPADRTDEVIAAIQKLTGAVLGHNVNGTGTDTLGESGDDIIGKLLRGEPEKTK